MAFRFRNFKVYQEAKLLHKEVFKITAKFPRQFYYLSDQARRASLSVILNIAEGSSKQSDKDFNRFVAISLGSIDEVIACMEIAFDETLITEKEFKEIELRAQGLSLQLGSLSKKLKASSY